MKRSELQRHTPMLRSGKRLRARSSKGRIPAKVVDSVRRRSAGRCEAVSIEHECMGAATQMHHIRRQAQGGKHEAENLLHVCTIGHMTIHAEPALSAALGYLARTEAA